MKDKKSVDEENLLAKKIAENHDWQYGDESGDGQSNGPISGSAIEDNNIFEQNPEVKGYNFDKLAKEGVFDLGEFLQSYASTGFQASNLAKAIEICKIMRREKAKIFLAFTSNMVSCGLRETIKFLVKENLVDVLVTSAGGVEEDIIKCFKPFRLGEFNVPGSFLFDKGVNRTGNLFVPNDRYTYFDKFMQKFLKEIYSRQNLVAGRVNGGEGFNHEFKVFSPSDICYELGLAISKEKDIENRYEDSILYWAFKNKIPVYCPGIIDGALGDMIVYFKQKHKDFIVDVSKEVHSISKFVLNCEGPVGAVILGGGISKHFTLNANLFREGVDYAVYVNTGVEYDGSDSGARIDEAISWGKVKKNALTVKVFCEASIAFPLIVAGGFVDEIKKV